MQKIHRQEDTLLLQSDTLYLTFVTDFKRLIVSEVAEFRNILNMLNTSLH